jgi:hypothetical protein
MKKISILILLSLFTFSLSETGLIKYFQINFSGVGILEYDNFSELALKSIKPSKKGIQSLQTIIKDLKTTNNQTFVENNLLYYPQKMSFEMSLISVIAEKLKGEDKNYIIYSMFSCKVRIVKPPEIIRVCKKVLFGKKCQNMQRPSVTTKDDIKKVEEEVKVKVFESARVDLPKENYEKFKQILSFKFPKIKM